MDSVLTMTEFKLLGKDGLYEVWVDKMNLGHPTCDRDWLEYFKWKDAVEMRYAFFLKRRLELGIFVPCGEEGPYADRETMYKNFTTGLQKLDYEAACNEVLIEGWRLIDTDRDDGLWHNLKRQKVEILMGQKRRKGEVSIYIKSVGFTDMKSPNIEDLVQQIELKINQKYLNEKIYAINV